jgi:hypothetical protein
MQFCWAYKDKMLVKLMMDMPKHIRGRFVPQIVLASCSAAKSARAEWVELISPDPSARQSGVER